MRDLDLRLLRLDNSSARRTYESVLDDPNPTLPEAYELLSESLALNGLAILEKEGVSVVLAARNAQRSFIPVTTELPAQKPERMVSWVYEPKTMKADDINKNMRVLSSKDGEIIVTTNNRLIFTDWTSNIQKIAKTLEQVDTK